MMFFCFCWCLLLCVLDGLTMFFLSFQNSCFCSSKNRSRISGFTPSGETTIRAQFCPSLRLQWLQKATRTSRCMEQNQPKKTIDCMISLQGMGLFHWFHHGMVFLCFFFQCWRVCTHSCIEDVTNFHVSKSGGHPLSKKFTPDGLFHFSLGSL